MTDIHSHILPEVDDGADSLDMAVRMAKMAADSGITSIFVTPHCNIEGVYENYFGEELQELMYPLRNRLQEEKIEIELLPGMEIYASENVPELIQKGEIITLNHSRYPLIEFDFREDPSLPDYLIKELVNQGLHPIIAHPERYPFVQIDLDIVLEWIYQGCLLQINKGSILGGFGRRAQRVAHFLLDNRLAAVIASDAHGTNRRTPYLVEAYQYVINRYSKEYADILLTENPRRIKEDLTLISMRTEWS